MNSGIVQYSCRTAHCSVDEVNNGGNWGPPKGKPGGLCPMCSRILPVSGNCPKQYGGCGWNIRTIPHAAQIARRFHEVYEELAPQHSWETQKESRVPFDKLPARQRLLMCKVVLALIKEGTLPNAE